jgi:23S rRNA (guanosine2251-2'-O)-methyltransferase
MSEPPKTTWDPSQGLTLFGRNPALEALLDASLKIHCLHLADSNKPSGIITQIISEAERRGAEIRYHDRLALSRISKNGRQDQGVALDVVCPGFMSLPSFLELPPAPRRVLALDGVTNPQNVGMIIRSAVAAGVDGILYPKRGVAALGPLVVKASAGNLFKASVIRCETVPDALQELRTQGYRVAALEANAEQSLFDLNVEDSMVFVMGGETEGISPAVQSLVESRLSIPMANNVESLNVAVTAALVAFHIRKPPA